MTPAGHGAPRTAWDAARLVAYESARRPAPVPVPLPAALGAVLAAPLVARVPLPPADVSAMDGYAVSGPGPWRLVDAPGRPSFAAWRIAALEEGEATAVVTGAPVPPGTTAVLPVERASVRPCAQDRDARAPGSPPGALPDVLHGEIEPGRHVRAAGEECAAGEVVLDAGGPVGPAVLGLAAALGHDLLSVYPMPGVAAIVTGDELVDSGLPAPGRTRDAIGPMLPGLVAAAGGSWCGATRAPDRPGAFRSALDAAGRTAADVVLLSGASGKGPADHLRAVLRELDAELLVDGVACRPGHPQTFARLPDGRLLVGLPGNPFAALTAFHTLAAPALAALRAEPLPELPKAPARGFTAHPHDHRVVPARIVGGVAEPLTHGGPAMLRGVAGADRLAVVDPGAEATTVRLLGGAPWAG